MRRVSTRGTADGLNYVARDHGVDKAVGHVGHDYGETQYDRECASARRRCDVGGRSPIYLLIFSAEWPCSLR